MSNQFNVQELLERMISEAVQVAAQENWAGIQETVEYEFKAILERVEEIHRRRDAGKISKGAAERHFDNQVSLTESALHLEKVLRKRTVRRMIDAVLNVIGSIVNRYIGFDLIEVED